MAYCFVGDICGVKYRHGLMELTQVYKVTAAYVVWDDHGCVEATVPVWTWTNVDGFLQMN